MSLFKRKKKISSGHSDDLYTSFRLKYQTRLERMEGKIVNLRALANSAKDYKQKLVHLNKCNEAIEALKSFCYSKGVVGRSYYKQAWEHVHNSRNPDFSYQESVIDEIERTRDQYEHLLPELKHAIYERQELLQTDLYIIFPTYPKDQIRDCLEILVREEGLKKKKSGRTNLLYF